MAVFLGAVMRQFFSWVSALAGAMIEWCCGPLGHHMRWPEWCVRAGLRKAWHFVVWLARWAVLLFFGPPAWLWQVIREDRRLRSGLASGVVVVLGGVATPARTLAGWARAQSTAWTEWGEGGGRDLEMGLG